MSSVKKFAPAADRNKDPILNVLQKHVTSPGKVLEVSSGSGQHIAHFANKMPRSLIWQPSEYAGNASPTSSIHPLQEVMESIKSYTEGMENVLPPFELDASSSSWPVDQTGGFTCVLVSNLTHIAPFDVTQGLLNGAGRILTCGGLLMIYGPFKVGGVASPESNVNFDNTLQSQNSTWGLRDMETVVDLASKNGFVEKEIHDMPANNYMLVFEKSA
eukprot:CAMPEP_0196573874 /NCGR_PEP_ID=MMETSP1081-20130531/3695_1 /TAXON_ID=36882 /ORGANISM="Pyramimonas amylifera, Strain CCMP720" /LENGTH=215 /DNA_ID=CAMNT_0041891715 /DNA_START=96 /DNA_END=743 /DNA_ORIENTATION=+